MGGFKPSGGLPRAETPNRALRRKRHLLVDLSGLLLTVVVQAADGQDRDGAKRVLEKVKRRLPRPSPIWGEEEYAGQLVAWAKTGCGWALEISKRTETGKALTHAGMIHG